MHSGGTISKTERVDARSIATLAQLDSGTIDTFVESLLNDKRVTNLRNATKRRQFALSHTEQQPFVRWILQQLFEICRSDRRYNIDITKIVLKKKGKKGGEQSTPHTPLCAASATYLRNEFCCCSTLRQKVCQLQQSMTHFAEQQPLDATPEPAFRFAGKRNNVRIDLTHNKVIDVEEFCDSFHRQIVLH